MSQWYYSVDGAQQGPVALEQISQWATAGQFDGQTLVWREGMSQWLPAAKVPELAGIFGARRQQAYAAPVAEAVVQPQYAAPAETLNYQGPSTGESVTPRIIAALVETKPWVRLFSVLLFIAVGIMGLAGLIQLLGVVGFASSSRRGGGVAALGLLSVVGTVLLSLLYFFPAMYLGRYASRIADLSRSRRQSDLEAAMEAQKSYWKFIGILTLIVIVIYAIVFVVVLGAGSRRF
ncbi:DUF4339 domain-containing protein [Humisphaera borealis]|uniref:DUF4339 domain-containing protein n=1 Tax=Humisphaera borealis TaxID=2807512 RepID=A0A7M2WXZ5_9BACT|nr:DUF4339 domain-containing protein [Humisphaera borealis]QOV89390.1 DUF4339 domain-containing protein [Humisphaera borealis]